MKELEKLICQQALDDHEYVVSLRRHFHAHPELSKQEYKTADKIEEELHKLGLETERVGETGVFTKIKGHTEGKTVLLRADMDALPINEQTDCPYKSQNANVMHACGHDSHTASLLGAARILSQNTDKFAGTILLAFQQAEECGYGGRLFVDGGYLDGADRVIGMHIKPDLDCGTVGLCEGPTYASVDWFRITVNGKAAHVSTPDKGVDALYIASQIVVAIQALVSRLASPMENLLIGIGKLTAGESYNIVAPKAVMEGTIRAFSPTLRQETKERIEETAKHIAAIYGGTVSLEWADYTSPLINDGGVTAEALIVAERLFGHENVTTRIDKALVGDDFAEYLLKVPGTYIQFGTRNADRPETALPLHNEKVNIDEDYMKYSVQMFCCYAMDFLNNEIE